MDDRSQVTLAPPSSGEVYQCPGESYSIDRSVHLGRLAAFYPACRTCERRHETHSLSSAEREQWEEVSRRSRAELRFTADSLSAPSIDAIPTAAVRQFATALATRLWQERPHRLPPPTVLVAADGHWTTAALVDAACEALQWSGCRAIDLGATTSAVVAMSGLLLADAAMWIGNPGCEPHSLEIKLWGTQSLPWSSPGGLDQVRQLFQAKVDRPRRSGGVLERFLADERYLAPLRPLFHGLRPLKMVIDTTCDPVVRQFSALAAQAACEVSRHIELVDLRVPAAARSSFVARRLVALGRQVVADHAHFGLWIDGAAEACHLVDEQGTRVSAERFLVLLARTANCRQPGANVVLERQSEAVTEATLARDSVSCLRSEATREAMFNAMAKSGAALGGGPSGRFWFSGEPPAADALVALSMLLTILSQSDRPLSEVLDEG